MQAAVGGGQRQPHLQEPASSTSVWGTEAREAEAGAAGGGHRGEDRQTERKRGRVTAARPPSRNAGQEARARPSGPPLVHPSVCLSTTPASPRAAPGPPRLQGPQERLAGWLPAPSFPAAVGWSGGDSRQRSVPLGFPHPGPTAPQPTTPTVSTQKRSLCSRLARARGPGRVLVHSKAKATMRASITARWAPWGWETRAGG